MTHRVLAGTSSTLRAPNFTSVLLGITNLDLALWAWALARRRESKWRPLWTPRLSCTRHVLCSLFTEMTVYGPINSGANLLLSGFRAHALSLIWNVTYFLSSCSQTRLSPCSEAFDQIANNKGILYCPGEQLSAQKASNYLAVLGSLVCSHIPSQMVRNGFHGLLLIWPWEMQLVDA